LVESELLDLQETEIINAMAHIVSNRTPSIPYIRPYGKMPNHTFSTVFKRISCDLTEVILNLPKETAGLARELILNGLSVRVMFPALVDAIRESEVALPEKTFTELGFDIGKMHEQGTTIEAISLAVQNERGNARFVSTVKAGGAQDTFGSALSVFISLLFALNVIFSLGSLTDSDGKARWGYVLAAMFYPVLVIFSVRTIKTISMSVQARTSVEAWEVIAKILMNPVQSSLRRVANFTRLDPWMGFGIFMCILMSCSSFGVNAYEISTEPNDNLEPTQLVMIFAAVTFIISCMVYYKYYVLNSSALAVLFMTHPRGIEILEES
jgi:hypothetical protein